MTIADYRRRTISSIGRRERNSPEELSVSGWYENRADHVSKRVGGTGGTISTQP